MAYDVRLLSDEDVQKCIDMAKRFVEESVVPVDDFDAEAVKSYLYYVIHSDDAFSTVVCNGNEIAGIIIAQIDSYVFSPASKICQSVFFFVQPKYRPTRTSWYLNKALEDWARDRDAKEIFLSTSSGISAEGFRRVFEKNGYATVGYTLRKAL